MVQNAIKENRVRLNMTQAQLADALQIDDKSPLTLSVIETGKALPTKPYLKALGEVLQREPLELYSAEDLDLLGTSARPIVPGDVQITQPPKSDRNHTGLVEFRTWLKPHEKENIERAVFFLGYRNMAEWFREAYRNLIQREMRIKNTTPTDV